MDAVELAVTAVRVWLGVVMVAHGLNHARSLDGTAKWFGKVGFKLPRRQAQVSAFGEVTIGASLVAGFLTSFGAFGLIAIVSVAFWSIHRFAGLFVFNRPDEGYEYVATLALAALALAAIGPGPVSVDAALGIADELDGWVGLGVAALGVLAAAAQLVLFWRR
ncbi:MAG: DoxX family protein, partial [Acidimicrobiia bacterium]